MDALVLDIAVQILSALSVALLVWGGWLCLGATSGGGRIPGRGRRG
jgi:hypothetical protein